MEEKNIDVNTYYYAKQKADHISEFLDSICLEQFNHNVSARGKSVLDLVLANCQFAASSGLDYIVNRDAPHDPLIVSVSVSVETNVDKHSMYYNYKQADFLGL